MTAGHGIIKGMFWDNVDISVTAGNGGNGLVSFRRERGEAMGGPDGGDGGDGGSVVIVASGDENTLANYARKKEFKAVSGKPGGKGRKHGKSADNLQLKVPIGTVVYEGDRAIADLTNDGQEANVAKGGQGGYGNAHFKSSVRRAPRHGELGQPGASADIRLELKLVADIGLVGIPSVGKSTLLSRITSAKPKIADYPFTTTIPQLGIAQVDDKRFAVADIPGLIEGAHQGKGLGDAFLRHIERTRVIIHLLDATVPDPVADYRTIRKELESYSPELSKKPEIVVLNKIDAVAKADRPTLKKDVEQRLGQSVQLVSAVSGEGIPELLRAAGKLASATKPPVVADAMPTFTVDELAPRAVSVTKDGDTFKVSGPRLERLAQQTDFENPGAVRRFWWIANRMGVPKRLEKLGADKNATISIAGKKIAWDQRKLK
ncbi:GTPase ObgE [Patescibacteria group bacterium]|nr:GTPase ObgE [Patescibacteria group bacterium]